MYCVFPCQSRFLESRIQYLVALINIPMKTRLAVSTEAVITLRTDSQWRNARASWVLKTTNHSYSY